MEQAAMNAGETCIAGVDEAGRGPLAGPVVAAAVVLDAARIPEGLNDSKLLSEDDRQRLFGVISASCAVGVAWAEPAQIDDMNILAATLWAMGEAVSRLPQVPGLALIDGNIVPNLSCRCDAVIKGDTRSVSIAAASIVAKVTRDRIMQEFDAHYPMYGFARHKGYPTPEHRQALKDFGPCPIHRQSFSPVREATLARAR
jgi:ribonuclease HII